MARKAKPKAKVEKKKTEAATPVESEYKVSEFAENAKTLFDTRPECVTAALKGAKKETYTVSEAKSIVEAFLKKEVK